MTMEQIDLISDIDLNLKYAQYLANDINEDIFTNADEKANIDKFTWEFSRLQAFSFMALEYLQRVQECVDALTGEPEE